MLSITAEAHEELDSWLSNLDDYKLQPIWHSSLAVRVVYLDVSDSGYGGYTVEHKLRIVYGRWSQDELTAVLANNQSRKPACLMVFR